jgi:enoyl-CoA hydratase/carnithine racemase
VTAEVTVAVTGHVAVVEMHRPPANFFDEALLRELATALGSLDENPDVRSVVLCAEGKHFCAGAQLGDVTPEGLRRVYGQALKLFQNRRPIVAAVQGAAVGGGLGLALAADFRVATAATRFTANFARLGFHQGFGLTVTLPAVVGRQRALDMLYTGRDVFGDEALAIGLADRLADDPREAAFDLATEIAGSAPLSVTAIRSTMRRELISAVSTALDAEAAAQAELLPTADFREGLDAARNRRTPQFVGA